MIIIKNANWFKMLFMWKGSVLPKILPRLSILLIISIGVVFFKGVFFNHKIPLNPAPFTLFGIALALFLGFRNTASYERFWEARKIWGALNINARSLARQALTLSGYRYNSKEITVFINYLISFTYALKHQLRHTDASEDLSKRLSPDLAKKIESVKFKPVILLKEMAIWIKEAKDVGNIDSILQSAFDENLDKLSEIVGGCERIASTPIPYTYRILLHRTVYFYCLLLPFGFVDSLGWITPLITIFIAYTFVALEAIADEIEEPFGTEPNDLALNEICRIIEISLLEMAEMPIPFYSSSNSIIVD